MKILLLKAFHVKDLGHELQQRLSFFSSDLEKFKLEAQLKTLTHIVDQKQVGIRDELKIISSINPSQKLLLTKAPRLILTVPAIIYDSRTSKLLFNSYYFCRAENVNKLKLAEVANQFCFEN